MEWNNASSGRAAFNEAFCGIAAKYEAPQMRYEAKPFQASCFLPWNQGKKNGGEGVTPETIVFFAYLASKVIDYQALIPVFL